jgi:hypothetical protein
LNLVFIKSIFLFLVVSITVGCAATSPSLKSDVSSLDCNKKLAFIQSPENTVSDDGFTILYDGENKEIFAELIEQAHANQMASGCIKG